MLKLFMGVISQEREHLAAVLEFAIQQKFWRGNRKYQ